MSSRISRLPVRCWNPLPAAAMSSRMPVTRPLHADRPVCPDTRDKIRRSRPSHYPSVTISSDPLLLARGHCPPVGGRYSATRESPRQPRRIPPAKLRRSRLQRPLAAARVGEPSHSLSLIVHNGEELSVSSMSLNRPLLGHRRLRHSDACRSRGCRSEIDGSGYRTVWAPRPMSTDRCAIEWAGPDSAATRWFSMAQECSTRTATLLRQRRSQRTAWDTTVVAVKTHLDRVRDRKLHAQAIRQRSAAQHPVPAECSHRHRPLPSPTPQSTHG